MYSAAVYAWHIIHIYLYVGLYIITLITFLLLYLLEHWLNPYSTLFPVSFYSSWPQTLWSISIKFMSNFNRTARQTWCTKVSSHSCSLFKTNHFPTESIVVTHSQVTYTTWAAAGTSTTYKYVDFSLHCIRTVYLVYLVMIFCARISQA